MKRAGQLLSISVLNVQRRSTAAVGEPSRSNESIVNDITIVPNIGGKIVHEI